MNPYYNHEHTKEEVTAILGKIQDCVREGRYIISQNENRKENIDLINEYNISTKKQSSILLEIKPEDFCYSLQNTNLGYEHEVLYVFVPQVKLFNINDEEEMVDVYTKFNVIDRVNGNRVIVISFHKRNKPIDYLFR
ncbi:hypothetical protein JYG23_01025 [Sedimentibacter sp. zth1]|uniref:hypothetical protein n=1 Tax=Sedimentibacter sp. zth1 TaxID=2816908 RepID=UPI001A92BC10|nr:hypothetical protein [Sedimentibacter sp. zth1]QSX06079.1 hypothetical protein JYG23_01025 [Sedimentibacter sp. zth1]